MSAKKLLFWYPMENPTEGQTWAAGEPGPTCTITEPARVDANRGLCFYCGPSGTRTKQQSPRPEVPLTSGCCALTFQNPTNSDLQMFDSSLQAPAIGRGGREREKTHHGYHGVRNPERTCLSVTPEHFLLRKR